MQELIKTFAQRNWKKAILLIISAVLLYYNIEL